MREISVKIKSAWNEGHCNACDDHLRDHKRGKDYPVYEISLRGCSLRVCETCRQELLGKLQ